MPPPPLLKPSSLTSFFFYGSIRMLSGLNWFVALCVCCLCVSCRAFVSCVSDVLEAHHPSSKKLARRWRQGEATRRNSDSQILSPSTVIMSHYPNFLRPQAVPCHAAPEASLSPPLYLTFFKSTVFTLQRGPILVRAVMIYAHTPIYAHANTRTRTCIAVQQHKRGAGSAIVYRSADLEPARRTEPPLPPQPEIGKVSEERVETRRDVDASMMGHEDSVLGRIKLWVRCGPRGRVLLAVCPLPSHTGKVGSPRRKRVYVGLGR